MRILLFTILLLSFISCSTDIHNHEEKKLSSQLQNMFPDGVTYCDGDVADLRHLQDRALAIYFTSVNNPQSPEFESLLSDMAIKFDYRLSVVVVNSGPNTEEFRNEMSKYGNDFYMVTDKRSKTLTSKFKIVSTPSLLVFNGKGELIDEDGVDSLVNNYPRIPVGWK